MSRPRVLLSLILLVGLVTVHAAAESFTGSISFGDGMTGAEVWNRAELSWVVDNETNPGLWTYSYTFMVGPTKEISSVIVGAAGSLSSQNVEAGTTIGCEIGLFGQEGNSTPGIPGGVYGLKCEPEEDSLTYSWMIVADIEPDWVDFYSKSGKHRGEWVFVHNTMFALRPTDESPAHGNNGGWVLGPGITYHQRMVRDSVLGEFLRIREVLAPNDESQPRVEFFSKFVRVRSDSWTYTLDSIGRQVFKPNAMAPHLQTALASELSESAQAWLERKVPETTVERARILASLVFGADYAEVTEPIVRPARELIASRSADTEEVRFHAGRRMVMFRPVSYEEERVQSVVSNVFNSEEGPTVRVAPVDLPAKPFETAVSFVPGHEIPGTVGFDDTAIRVESAFVRPEIEESVQLLFDGLSDNLIEFKRLESDRLNFGTFFSAEERRLEIIAYSYEGEKWLQDPPPFTLIPLPDVPQFFCTNSRLAPSVDSIRASHFHRWWVWWTWHRYGRKNGARGNWNQVSQSWENSEIDVILHRDLKTYDLAIPTWFRQLTLKDTCDDESLYPYWSDWKVDGGVANRFEDAFHEDLERCHIAMINTHGGTLKSLTSGLTTFSFLRNWNRWVTLREPADPRLGNGNLRHLLLETCAPINWNFHEPQNLFTDWMVPSTSDGLRTVCGFDGTAMGGDRPGWRFFGHYHGGESVSQSWFNKSLEQSDFCVVPIVVGYGGTENEALANLFDERFRAQRSDDTWMFASEVIPERVTHESRACCMGGGVCEERTRGDCLTAGGRPLDCSMHCEQFAEEHCGQ